MRVSTAPRVKNALRPAEKSAPAYGQWLRGRACACAGKNPNCGGKIQAAHGPHKASKGTGTKSADQWMMPLSVECHRLQHVVGWPRFASYYLKGPPLDVCLAYWTAWPGRIAWERKLNDGK